MLQRSPERALLAVVFGCVLQSRVATDPVSGSTPLLTVEVAVSITSPDYRQYYTAGELDRIRAAAASRLQEELARRNPHLAFSTDPRSASAKLTATLTAADEAPDSALLSRVDWVFELTHPGVEHSLSTRWDYLGVGDLYRALPPVETLLVTLDRYLGAPAEDGSPGSTPAVEGRYLQLFDRCLRYLPLFADAGFLHVAHTGLIVVRVPRPDYACSLPDGSGLEVGVKVEEDGGVAPQERHFRSRVLDRTAVERRGAELAEFGRCLILEAIGPEASSTTGTTIEHLARLSAAPHPQEVLRRAFVADLGRLEFPCPEIRPSAYPREQ